MKYAIGCKMVKFEEKTYGEYTKNKYGENKPMSDLPDDSQGYEVHYVDQTPPYVSWTPKEVFERFYYPIESEDGSILNSNDIDRFFWIEKSERLKDQKTTFVKGNTLTGFVQYDTSSCVDPKNYNQKFGENKAALRIKDKIYFGMGFVLQWARFGLNYSS